MIKSFKIFESKLVKSDIKDSLERILKYSNTVVVGRTTVIIHRDDLQYKVKIKHIDDKIRKVNQDLQQLHYNLTVENLKRFGIIEREELTDEYYLLEITI